MNDAQKATSVKVGVGLLGLLILGLLAPMIWAMVSAGVGLLALGLVAVGGFGMLSMLPFLGQKLENRVLSMRKQEARANPIEQLQNFFLEKKERVKQFRDAVVSIGSQIESMKAMVADRKRKKPNYDSTDEDKAIASMTAAHQKLVTKYHDAEASLVQVQEAIEEKKFKWNFSKAGQSALTALSASSGEDLLSQMLNDEADSSVLDNFNKVFAELELEAGVLTESKQLSFDSGQSGLTLDVSSINLTNMAKVVK